MAKSAQTTHRYLHAAVLGLVALLAAACGAANDAPANGAPANGALDNGRVDLQIPDMDISAYQGASEIGGEEVLLSEVLGRGKPVVLNFWAALCPPCRAEMPDFQRVYEQRSNEVTILGIDVGPQLRLGTRDQGRDLLRELNITYPAGTTFEENVARSQRILGMPTTMFIHADGRLMRTWTGLMDEATMNNLIDELLEG